MAVCITLQKMSDWSLTFARGPGVVEEAKFLESQARTQSHWFHNQSVVPILPEKREPTLERHDKSDATLFVLSANCLLDQSSDKRV